MAVVAVLALLLAAVASSQVWLLGVVEVNISVRYLQILDFCLRLCESGNLFIIIFFFLRMKTAE